MKPQAKKLQNRRWKAGRRTISARSARSVVFPPPTVEAAFRTLETATVRHLEPGAGNRLRISVVPSFAASWLTPRLGRFSAAHPAAELAIETETGLVDLRREPVDLAIRHGLGRYPGLEVHRIVSPAMVVVASPRLLASGPPITSPADCRNYPLLQDQDRQDWRLWLEALGVEPTGLRTGAAFSDDYLLVRAAVEGLALVRDLYAADEIAAGRLVRVLDTAWPTEFAYYLVGLPATFERPAARRLAAWLLAEAAEGL